METDPRLVSPPPITHPEYFCGFAGVGIAFQVVFLIISLDPIKYRRLMIPSMIEKFSFSGANLVLFPHQRLAKEVVPGTLIDGILGLLFLASYSWGPVR